MKLQDKILKHISLIKNLDVRIIKNIVYHPLLFAKKKMADPDEYRPIRIRYFGVFIQKYMHNKEMFKKLSYIIKALKEHHNLYKIFIDPTFETDLEARIFVNKLFDEDNKQAILDIYNAIIKAIEKQ